MDSGSENGTMSIMMPLSPITGFCSNDETDELNKEAAGAPNRAQTEEAVRAVSDMGMLAVASYRHTSSDIVAHSSTGSYRVSSATPSRQSPDDDDSNSDLVPNGASPYSAEDQIFVGDSIFTTAKQRSRAVERCKSVYRGEVPLVVDDCLQSIDRIRDFLQVNLCTPSVAFFSLTMIQNAVWEVSSAKNKDVVAGKMPFYALSNDLSCVGLPNLSDALCKLAWHRSVFPSNS